jgi:hypothetical protein
VYREQGGIICRTAKPRAWLVTFDDSLVNTAWKDISYGVRLSHLLHSL